jgi:hypothetical protein
MVMLSGDIPSLFGPRQHGQSAGYAVVASTTATNAAKLVLIVISHPQFWQQQPYHLAIIP